MSFIQMQVHTHNIARLIRYVVRAGTTFNLHTNDARLVHNILYVVTILADYFTYKTRHFLTQYTGTLQLQLIRHLKLCPIKRLNYF